MEKQRETDFPRLIVGLGNPGRRYENTRHNLGFMVVSAFAKEQGWDFKLENRLKGAIASGVIEGSPIYLLLPMTYMNMSGEVVKKAVDAFHIPYQAVGALIVVVDDVYLPLGALRFRRKGSAGGHNGLKSVEHFLKTKDYERLKVGMGSKAREEWGISLEDYVLSTFLKEEEKPLQKLVEDGAKALEYWVKHGCQAAMQIAKWSKIGEGKEKPLPPKDVNCEES